MSKMYTCTVSNKQFESEEELFAHYMKHYVKHQEEENAIQALRKAVMSVYPDCRLTVRKYEGTESRSPYYAVHLENMPYRLRFSGIVLSPTYTLDPRYFPGWMNTNYVYPTAEEMIAFLQDGIQKAENFVEEVRQAFETEEVALHKITTEGRFKLEAEVTIPVGYETASFYYDCSEKEENKEYVLRQISGLFTHQAEGLVEVEDGMVRLDSVRVGDVKLHHILLRAKRIRIEILEEKQPFLEQEVFLDE